MKIERSSLVSAVVAGLLLSAAGAAEAQVGVPVQIPRGAVAPTLPTRPGLTPIPLPPPIRGFADLHSHQFGNLGFGGLAMAGQPFQAAPLALRWCDDIAQHGPGGVGDTMGNLIASASTGASIVGHVVGGYPKFDGWPSWKSLDHQQMWEEWLYRAFRGGLKLMVMHAVNNEHFCSMARQAQGFTCNDQDAIAKQIAGAQAMQFYIDQRSGGPGKGWYRLVFSPQEARQAIAAGQLAVVLGAEVDNPFPNSNPAAALAQLDSYYQMGIRHLFPIHFKDNTVGGASYDKRLGHPSGKLASIDSPYAFDLRDCSSTYRREGGVCNRNGLNPLGALVLRGMMNKGMIIDVDHMSELSFNAAMDLVDSQQYPVVSGHTGFVELAANARDPDKSHEGNMTPAKLGRIQRSGGMVAIIPNQGKLDQIDTFRGGPVVVEHTCGNSSETVAQAYLYAITRAPGMPVGFGTDMNTFFFMPSPRFGSEACGWGGQKGPRYGQVNQAGVNYPFIAIATGQQLGRSKAVENDPQVTRTFDYNVDGLAHIGLLPDLVEDLRRLGIPDAALEPLMSSAEGYVRTWERAEARRLPNEVPACGGLRGQVDSVNLQINSTNAEIGRLANEQKSCQTAGGKPGACRDPETVAVIADKRTQLGALVQQRTNLLQQKTTAACWY